MSKLYYGPDPGIRRERPAGMDFSLRIRSGPSMNLWSALSRKGGPPPARESGREPTGTR